jgi:hypothetical protein
MPAGDLLTGAAWEFEMNGLLTGGATAYRIDRAGGKRVEGFGVPQTKTADVDLPMAHGAYPSPDFMGVRVITVPYKIHFVDPDDAMAAFLALCYAWEPVEADLELHGQLPGLRFHVVGRPRGVQDDLRDLTFGTVYALARFDCLDPALHEHGS